MWCVFHNAQRYWSDNLCKLVTDQWRASLGVRDSESCWFTEEIGTYLRCWESPGDLPLVIEIFITRGRLVATTDVNTIFQYETLFCCYHHWREHNISVWNVILLLPPLTWTQYFSSIVDVVVRYMVGKAEHTENGYHFPK